MAQGDVLGTGVHADETLVQVLVLFQSKFSHFTGTSCLGSEVKIFPLIQPELEMQFIKSVTFCMPRLSSELP